MCQQEEVSVSTKQTNKTTSAPTIQIDWLGIPINYDFCPDQWIQHRGNFFPTCKRSMFVAAHHWEIHETLFQSRISVWAVTNRKISKEIYSYLPFLEMLCKLVEIRHY